MTRPTLKPDFGIVRHQRRASAAWWFTKLIGFVALGAALLFWSMQ